MITDGTAPTAATSRTQYPSSGTPLLACIVRSATQTSADVVSITYTAVSAGVVVTLVRPTATISPALVPVTSSCTERRSSSLLVRPYAADVTTTPVLPLTRTSHASTVLV